MKPELPFTREQFFSVFGDYNVTVWPMPVGRTALALVAYPAWSWLAGHRYPETPTFGLPCPTTIFTIGILAFLSAPIPRSVVVVPLLADLAGLALAWRAPASA